MNERIKQLWIHALRSGEYQQGKGGLRPDDEGFCCLGVLCDLHSQETGKNWDVDQYDGQSGVLPDSVCIWADLIDLESGFPNVDPKVMTPHSVGTLAHHNDNLNFTFQEIADIIERQL